MAQAFGAYLLSWARSDFSSTAWSVVTGPNEGILTS